MNYSCCWHVIWITLVFGLRNAKSSDGTFKVLWLPLRSHCVRQDCVLRGFCWTSLSKHACASLNSSPDLVRKVLVSVLCSISPEFPLLEVFICGLETKIRLQPFVCLLLSRLISTFILESPSLTKPASLEIVLQHDTQEGLGVVGCLFYWYKKIRVFDRSPNGQGGFLQATNA